MSVCRKSKGTGNPLFGNEPQVFAVSVLPVVLCRLQQEFGLIRLRSESLIMNAYPVVMKLKDFVVVPATVLLIGFWAAWYPVRYLTKKYLKK